MYFTIEAASGGYRGHAYGDNHKLVWWTEVYISKAGVQNAIRLLQLEASTAPVYDRA